MKYICSKNVFINGNFVPASIGIENNKIAEISDYGKGECHFDNYIIPGLIDIHTHGGYGCDTNNADLDNMLNWIKHLPSEGTTSLLISPYTSTIEKMQNSVDLIDSLRKQNLEASVLGCHLEGPFISNKHLGAMNEKYILKPNINTYKEIAQDHEECIKLITLACELEKAYDLMDYLTAHHTVVSVGHSGCTYEAGLEAKKHGLKGFTHTYNGMLGLHHREVGTVGCSLLFDDCYSECICDGYHVSFEALKILFRCKPKDKVILVTDSLKTKGLPEGNYELDGEAIEMRHGCAYMAGTDSLSGSTLSMIQAMRNVVKYCEISLEDAVLAGSQNPATYLGVHNKKGIIQIGNDADLCILDHSLNLNKTIHLGQVVYTAS